MCIYISYAKIICFAGFILFIRICFVLVEYCSFGISVFRSHLFFLLLFAMHFSLWDLDLCNMEARF